MVQQSSAAVATAKAAAGTAYINLAYTKVISPINGRAGKFAVTEGALAQNGQTTALVIVQQLDPIYVDVIQSNNDFLCLKQGLAGGRLKQENGKARVELVANDGLKYPQVGTLESSDVIVDQATGSITLRVISPNPNHILLPGMFVRARLEGGVNPDALLVLQWGVIHTPHGDASIMVIGEGDKVKVRQVTASQAIGGKRLVTDGLETGDRVTAADLQKIKPDMQVKAQEVASDDK